MDKRDVWLYEEGGYFWITDRYDLNRVRFNDSVSRRRWLDEFPSEVGRQLSEHVGKPNVLEELAKS